MDVTLRATEIALNSQTSKLVSGNQVVTAANQSKEQKNEYAKSMESNPLSREDTEHMTEQMNKLMELMDADLHFTLHEKTNRLIVQMVDKRDGTVLKEFPPRELLDTLANIQEYVGILLDKKV